MKTLSILACSLAVLPFFSAPAAAQVQEMQVRSLAFQPDFPVELHAHDPSGSETAGLIEIKSFLNHEGNLLKYKGTGVSFTRRTNPASATNVDEVIGKVEFPTDTKSCILLFIPTSQLQGNFQSRVVAIDDSAKAFPSGSFKVVNFASVAVKIELEKEIYEIPPGELKVITNAPFGEGQSVSMHAFCKRGEQWELVSTGVWTNPGTRRVLQVVTEDPDKQIELKGIRDVVIPDAPAPEVAAP
ncbi:MAG: hypothetical protein ABIT37_25005 [Luteolibacter sp.]